MAWKALSRSILKRSRRDTERSVALGSNLHSEPHAACTVRVCKAFGSRLPFTSRGFWALNTY